jgi:uncharacterized protein (TIGR03437 family)
VIRPWTAIAGSPVGALAVNWDVVMNFTPSETAAVSRPTLVSMAGITHGATLTSGAASGSWVTLSGAGLAPATRTWRASDIVNNRLPQSLDEVSVRINDQPASIYYISPTQLNVIAPETTADGTAQVTVTAAGLTSDPVSVPFKRFAPGFFQFPDQYAAAVRADGTYLGPSGLIDGVTTVPARPGDAILLYGTGFGPTNPPVDAGSMVTTPAPTANAVSMRLGNVELPVSFAGLVSPGLYQFNVKLPADLADGDYPVTAQVAGAWTARFVRLRIERATSGAAAAPSGPWSPLRILDIARA